MYNNCKALRAGLYSYKHLSKPVLLGPPHMPRTYVGDPGNTGNTGNMGSFSTTSNSDRLGSKDTTAGPGKNTSAPASQSGKNGGLGTAAAVAGGSASARGVSGSGTAERAEGMEHTVVGTRSGSSEGSIISLAVALSG